MKTKTKWLIGAVVLGLVVGGYTMKELVFGFGDEVVAKKLTREEKQLAYLKEHEQEIVDFVKAQNPKIESVQIDWDETRWVKGGHMFETNYAIYIFGKFNNFEESEWGIYVFYDDKDGNIDMSSMVLYDGLRLEGDYFE